MHQNTHFSQVLIIECRKDIIEIAGLDELSSDDYEFYGPHSAERQPSSFALRGVDLSPITINAFNYSRKIKTLIDRIYSIGATPLASIIDDRQLYHTSAFRRLELSSPKSIKLLGQKELFTINKEGKFIASRYVPAEERAVYGEVLVAGVGTMGESEIFCRAEFVGKELEGQCIAGEFIRMSTIDDWHPGYLYAWLSTEYGFRFIRSTESGTKLCRPIKQLLLEMPIPNLTKSIRDQIGAKIEDAFEKRYQSYCKEQEAISIVEKELS